MQTSVTGTITVENGVVVEMDSEITNQAQPTSVNKGTLHTILRDLQKHGSSDQSLGYRHWQDKSDQAVNDKFEGDIANQ